MAQMKEQNKTPGKELIKVEISNRSDAELKTLVIRMLQELTGYFNSIKKHPHRNEGYANWNNNLQGNHNRINEAKNQIDDLEDKETEKNKTTMQNNKKKSESKKMRIV